MGCKFSAGALAKPLEWGPPRFEGPTLQRAWGSAGGAISQAVRPRAPSTASAGRGWALVGCARAGEVEWNGAVST